MIGGRTEPEVDLPQQRSLLCTASSLPAWARPQITPLPRHPRGLQRPPLWASSCREERPPASPLCSPTSCSLCAATSSPSCERPSSTATCPSTLQWISIAGSPWQLLSWPVCGYQASSPLLQLPGSTWVCLGLAVGETMRRLELLILPTLSTVTPLSLGVG